VGRLVEAGSEQARRIAQLRRLQREGRKVKGVVVGQVDTGRTVADQPVIAVTIEVDDGGEKRRVVYSTSGAPAPPRPSSPAGG
jgi:hypothetical protein